MKVLLPALLFSMPTTLLATDDALRKEVRQAAHALSQRDSYAWTATTQSAEGTEPLRQGPTHGSTQKNRATHVTFTLRDSQIELAFRGDHAAIKWDDQWRAKNSLTGDVAWIADRLNGYLFAAQEASFLAEHSHALSRADDGSVLGELRPAAIAALLSRGRRQVEQAPEMTGSIRFWLKDNHLEKYEYRLKGILPPADGTEAQKLDRTTVVEILKIDQTKVELSAEGEKALQ